MIVILGCVFVLAAVLTGFSMAGGHVGALIHPSEFITIGGAALGAIVIMSPKKVLVDLARGVVQAIKGTPYNKPMYVDLFKLLYVLARLGRREGLLALESHVTSPHESAVFQKYTRLTGNHHATEFLCNALSLLIDGKSDPERVMGWLEEEIRVIDREHHAAVGVLTKTADALPGFGIVAAVLGIVVTMQAIGGPVTEVGEKVGAALVGTFLGILMSYGFFAPMAGRMEFLGEAESTFFRVITAAVVAISKGESPKDVVMQARRGVSTDCRPNTEELTEIFREGETN
jgi:chemotaxis protein MotA